jgi:hypothetical protein
MNELMKGHNKRGREDFENAIPDDLETQNFQNFPALCQPWRRFVGVGPYKFIKLVLCMTKLWYQHKNTMQVHN